MTISKTTILIVAFFLTTIAIFVFNQSDSTPNSEDRTKPGEGVKPSAFIKNGRFTLYDETGYATTLTSSDAVFYPESDYIEIQSPQITLTSAEGDEIYLKALTGRYHPKAEKLTLNNGVRIEQVSPPDKAWSLTGEKFTLDSKTRFISTSHAVTIKKGSHTMSAIGLQAWLDNKKINLLSKVRGQYVFNN